MRNNIKYELYNLECAVTCKRDEAAEGVYVTCKQLGTGPKIDSIMFSVNGGDSITGKLLI